MININTGISVADLAGKLTRFWELSGKKIRLIDERYDKTQGSPVFTIKGQYATRGWTEWTQGFQYGSALLQFEATGERSFLELGRKNTVEKMAPHVSHVGVHDHGFNNVSTYGNLLRLMHTGLIPHDPWEQEFYVLALKISGAVQANRWTPIPDGGFIHSFNGPHSLFVDTIRSLRSLVLSHCLGHRFFGEGDKVFDLMTRTIQHLHATATYSIFYGDGRDGYDVRGRTAHEIIFNTHNGAYRCPNSQQGYTGFTTWTRGLAWAMCGFAEELEWFDTLEGEAFDAGHPKAKVIAMIRRAAEATCDYYIEQAASDGIPYWDTGAPNLHKLKDPLLKPADPFNAHEPVDSSAAAIAAQGLLRLGHYLMEKGELPQGRRYWQAGLTVMNALLSEPYLSTQDDHHGILLHSVYHFPNRWDYMPQGSNIPYGESSMWGDYHIREAAILLQHVLQDHSYHTFFTIR